MGSQPINLAEVIEVRAAHVISTLVEPNTPVGPSDHVLGEASASMKCLYTLAYQCDRTAFEFQGTARFGQNDDERRHAFRLWQAHEEKTKLLNELFWACLRDQHDAWDKPSVGIRNGWIAVWSENNQSLGGMILVQPSQQQRSPDGRRASGGQYL